MLTLTLEYGDGNVLDLDALVDHEEGGQAQPGATGMGLPTVSTQWIEGAGDGATFRSQRALPREVDLPIYFVASNRESLKEMARQIGIAFSGEVTLRLTDTEAATSWYLKARRVGGGDFSYGNDTNGDSFLQTVITLRAGSPFWTEDNETVVTQSDTAIGPTISIPNDGSADTYPVWEIDGPGINLKLTNPDGKQIWFSELIDKGATLVIDAEKGTVTDSGGNRYGGLAPAPRFFKIPPGGAVVSVEMDRTSATFLAAYGQRKNYVKNPIGGSSANFTANWTTVTGASFDDPTDTLTLTNSFANPDVTATTTITGLTVGKSYRASISAYKSGNIFSGGTLAVLNGATTVVSKGVAAGLSTYETLSVDFVAPATSLTLQLRARSAGGNYGSVFMRDAFVGEPGDYFDGDTPDDAEYTNAWTGTAWSSTSTRTLVTADVSDAEIRCKVKPRNWMVV